MTELNEIYRCNLCSNIVEMVHIGKGELVCCGQPMELLKEKTEDAGHEKHVPVIEIAGNSALIKVGSIEHPMLPGHYIEWIEVLSKGKVYKKFLKPGDKPEAEFPILIEQARAYCNVHGLWSS